MRPLFPVPLLDHLRKGDQWEAFQLQALHVGTEGRIDDVVGWFEPHLFRMAGLRRVLPESEALRRS